MPKCLICKVEPGPVYRTFHLFPKNEFMRQKWIDAINITNITKMPNFETAHICSDHFDSKSYFYSDEFNQRKRLCKEAVPTQISLIQSIDSKENDKLNNINLQSSTKKVSETSTEDEEELSLSDCEMLSCNIPSNKKNSKKRKQSFDDIRKAKQVRFMTGYKTEYLCRHDFVSKEAWNRFLRYLAYQKSETAAARNKNSRK
ncbi:uncharacterized protein LOC116845348 [Odontomachus brunneus]|uniref:uncharacterized protein LOC116845348 n=1 Tax=Odontomachus brunneus TaxID=486640 RepID=UPI0013F278C3|nr:uncharacterized protein LOC116845348 [Odontomachus brunneus]